MRNKRVLEITTIGIFSAIIFVMALVPEIGYIHAGVITLTLIHIPVLIGGIFGGKRVSISLGLAFGLSSMFIAFTRPVFPADFIFQNPLVSVLPRILFGYSLYMIYLFFDKYITNKLLAVSMAFVISTLVHSILVLVPFYIFAFDSRSLVGAVDLIVMILAYNGIIEALIAGIIGAPIAHRLKIELDNRV
ncbi:MAG: ECF transporter S component [Candidatus Izimaplasma sp.]|nr:ECF transporter S component [Candidatus Izimaplasma bacterium]